MSLRCVLPLKSAWLSALVIAAGCSSGADTSIDGGRASNPDVVVMASSERAAMDAVFSDFDDESPGCAVAVRSDDGDYLDAQYGLADLDADEPITAETVFDIGSVSKQLTAGAVALLINDGELVLEDDITGLVNELGLYNDVITVSDLLHHTSGLPDYVELLDAEDDEATTMADALDVITSAQGDPLVAPAVDFEYSNTNYVLLSIIVERTSSMSLAEFSATEIFEPLGMNASVVRDDQGMLFHHQAQGYADDEGEWMPAGSSWQQTGDGAVHSTPLDLLLWTELFFAEPADEGLGSDDWLDVMTSPGSVADGDDRYGGGLELIGNGDNLILRHGGSWIGYGSALVMKPSAGLAVAVACNIDGVDAESLAAETFGIWASPD